MGMKVIRNFYIGIVLILFLPLMNIFSQEEEAEKIVLTSLVTARLKNNLPVLTLDEQLIKTARDYSKELAFRGALSHRDLRGGRAAERFAWTRRTVILGEILGAGEDLTSLTPAWLNSPGHRKILLGTQWKAWGLGVTLQSKVWIAVVLFLE